MTLSLLGFSEFIGTVAFAMSGALLGIKKQLDYYGVVVLAIITALGGGIIRDLILGNTPPMALTAPFFTGLSIATAIFAILFYHYMERHQSIIQIFDAFGLAAFTVMGASMATSQGFTSPFIVVFIAILTGTGGGTMRDVVVREIPYVFRKEIYAVAAMAGAIVYLILYLVSESSGKFSVGVAVYACFAVTLIIRLLSIRFNFHLRVIVNNNESR